MVLRVKDFRSWAAVGGVAAALAGAPHGLSAQDRAAVVIGNFAYPTGSLPDPSRRAVEMSQTLQGLGFDVTRIENAASDLSPEVALPARAETLLFYFSGLAAEVDGITYLLPSDVSPGNPQDVVSQGWPLDRIRSRFAASGRRAILFLDICHGEASAAAPGGSVLSPPDLDDGIFEARSVRPGLSCAAGDGDFTDTVRAALRVPDADLRTVLDAELQAPVWTASTFRSGFIFRDGGRLNEADLALMGRLPDGDRDVLMAMVPEVSPVGEVRVGQDSPVVVVAPVERQRPIAPVAAPVVRVAAVPQTTGQVQNGVVLLAPGPGQDLDARPTAAGLPEPSIIVGIIRREEEAFETVEPEDGGTLAGEGIDGADPAVRIALKAEDPALFAELLNSGVFDPPEDELAAQIQVELARMNCYTAGIDGIWGGGSRGAVARYTETASVAVPTQEPAISLFRAIVGGPDVRCPAIVAAPTPAPQPQRNTTPRPAAPTPVVQPQQPPPTQPPQGGGRRINPASGTGIFR